MQIFTGMYWYFEHATDRLHITHWKKKQTPGQDGY